jgi:hypothetical protein
MANTSRQYKIVLEAGKSVSIPLATNAPYESRSNMY